MQLTTEQQLANQLDVLEKRLQEAPVNRSTCMETLLKLINSPETALSDVEAKWCQNLQTNLLDKDDRLRGATFMAIVISILASTKIGKKVAERVREHLQKGLESLDLSNCDLAQLETIGWHALGCLLRTSSFIYLDLADNDLGKIKVTNWEILCSALQTAKLDLLLIPSNNLAKLNRESWQTVCSLIEKGKLSTLFLRENRLGELSTVRWEMFCHSLKNSRLVSMQLSNNCLPLLNNGQWKLFCDTLIECKLDSLDLGGNNLGQISEIRWQFLCSAIQNAKFRYLNLQNNQLCDQDSASWHKLVSALEKLNLISLVLPDNNLGQMDHDCWHILSEVLLATNLRYLDLCSNNMHELDSRSWQIFCSTVQKSRLNTLDLSYNRLEQLSLTYWKILCNALRGSKLVSLNLDGNRIENLHLSRWNHLAKLLKDNYYLQVIKGLPEYAYRLLDSIFIRNRYLAAVCKTAFQLYDSREIYNKQEYLSLLNQAIVATSDAIALFLKKGSSNATDMKLRLQNLLDNLYWKKGDVLRMIAPKNQPSEHQLFMNQAIEAWLAVSPKGDHYEDARIELFQLAYLNAYKNCDTHIAFVEASIYLLDAQGRVFIKLKENNLSIFDAYLYAAAGGKGGLGKRFTAEDRLFFLRFVFLQEIQRNLEGVRNHNCLSKFFITNTHKARMSKLLKALPLDVNNMDAGSLREHQSIWREVNSSLKGIHLDPEMQTLLTAVTQLETKSGLSFQAQETQIINNSI